MGVETMSAAREVSAGETARNSPENKGFDPDRRIDQGNTGEKISAEKYDPDKRIETNNEKYHDDNGKLYRTGDDLLPNTQIEKNGFTFKTDNLGRVASAEGKLQRKNHDGYNPIKDSIETIGKGDQREGDDRGHLIGDQFNGPGGLENLIPQDANINRGAYKSFENELAKEVNSGKDVYLKVSPIYEGDSRRPSGLSATYTINNETHTRFFPNESGR